MRKLRCASYFAQGKNVLFPCLQHFIYFNYATVVCADLGVFQSKFIRIGNAACGNKNFVSL